MFLVVAVDRNWAIDRKNNLVYRIPVIEAQFRELIKGKTIIYQRDTMTNFPDGKPLAECNNLIYTFDTNYACDGATIIHSINELDEFPTDDLYVIGGSSVYRLLCNKCKYAFVAYVDSNSVGCNVFFPDLSRKSRWSKLDQTSIMHYKGLPYLFETYINNAVD